MTPMPGKAGLQPIKPEKPKVHPGGDCDCTWKSQRITRMYMGYGYCATCGNLTRHKILVRTNR